MKNVETSHEFRVRQIITKFHAWERNKHHRVHDTWTNPQHNLIPHRNMCTISGRLQTPKVDPNRVCNTARDNLIDYPHELTTQTTDLITTKILWNSFISMTDNDTCTSTFKKRYLATPMDRIEYMKIPIELNWDKLAQEYELHNKVKNGFLYIQIKQ